MQILYGLSGEGLGHATRAEVMVSHLLSRGHRVRVAASGRAARMLAARFDDVVPIVGMSLAYGPGRVRRARTFGRNVAIAPRAVAANARAIARLRHFDPDIVVTDFDSFAYAAARLLDRPVITLDHHHVIDRFEHDAALVRALGVDWRVVRMLVAWKAPRACAHVVTSFFHPARSRSGAPTWLVPPIVRPALGRLPVTRARHVLVYQTSSADGALMRALRRIDGVPFLVYGMGRAGRDGNITYRSHHPAAFLSDLASARAVIANAGHTALSEAALLGKPILSLPLAHHGEQLLNAAYVEHDGLGERLVGAHDEHIDGFLRRARRYERAPVRDVMLGTHAARAALDAAIEEAVR